MREVRETFYEKDIHIETKNPYIFALHILDAAKSFGKVFEKENIVLAKGTRNEIKVYFDILKKIDKKTKVIVTVEIDGEDRRGEGFLDVHIYAFFVIKFEEGGVIKESFEEFYEKELLPEIKKISKLHADEIIEKLERKIKNLKN